MRRPSRASRGRGPAPPIVALDVADSSPGSVPGPSLRRRGTAAVDLAMPLRIIMRLSRCGVGRRGEDSWSGGMWICWGKDDMIGGIKDRKSQIHDGSYD